MLTFYQIYDTINKILCNIKPYYYYIITIMWLNYVFMKYSPTLCSCRLWTVPDSVVYIRVVLTLL